MNTFVEAAKALIEPFLIYWSAIVCGVMYMTGQDTPAVMLGILGAAALKYFGVNPAVKAIKARKAKSA